MATISDGVTDIDIGEANERIDPTLDKSTKRTGGGNLRSITSGERLDFAVNCRLTPAKYRLVLNLLNNGASNYFYTPNASSEWTDLYASTNFPLNCNFSGIKRTWDNRGYYYVEFGVESTSYV